MCEVITATVLPREQLEYVLGKQGLTKDKSGDFVNKVFAVCFLKIDFDYCLAKVKIRKCRLEDHFFYKYETGVNQYWHKDWFVPNSFKEGELNV